MARVTPARNDPCPCGSGKKFKQCCGQKRAREEPATAADLRLLAGLADSRRFLELESRALEAIGRFPDSGPAWKALSVALRMQGKDALHALQKAAELLPADAEAQCNLGNALRHGGRLDEAVARYRQAIRNEPAYIEARHNLGNAQLALGRFDEAAASYREVLQINPNIAESHSNLGNALLALGRPEEAAASYRRALALNPELASAHSNLGDALRELGQSEQAAASCRRALAIDPNNAQAHNSLGNALLDLGRPADAAACYARALTLDSRFVKACVNLAIALRLLGSTSEADAACRKALEIDPTAAPALALLGELQADRGLFAEAETLFRRAAAIDPRMPEAWAGIAHLRKMTSDDASWLAQALRIADGVSKPREEAYLRYAIGKYCDDVGDYTGAFAQYRRANDLTKAYAPSYDRRRMTQAVDRIVRTCDRQWARMPRSLAMRTPRPVFIVGMPRSGTRKISPLWRVASRICTRGTVHSACARGAGPASVTENVCSPIVLPANCSVIIRCPPSLASVHWLSAAPVSASTSSPSGSAKLSLKRPARVIFTSRSTAITRRSSPSESTSLVVTRTSGATGATFSATLPPSLP